MSSRSRKLEEAYCWIRAYIDENQFSANNKLPSENAISMKLGISRDTVRNAMSELAEEGLVYRIRGSGTFINKAAALSDESLTMKNQLKIGLILQGQDRNANSGLISGIKSVLHETNAVLRIFFTDNRFASERNCLNSVVHQNFDGFIIDGVKASIINPNLDCYYNIFNKKIPVIFYNNYYKELKYPKVINNDLACADELLRRLIKAGHKHIAGIFVSDNYQSIEKFRGYVTAMQKYGAKFDDDNVKWCVSSEAYKIEFAKEIARFVKSVPQCRAIVCCNYMIMQTVLQVLAGLNKKVPDDYSIVCFDYSKDDWQQAGITCSVHPGFAMGVEVSRRLLKMIKSKQFYGNDFSYVFEPNIYDGRSIEPRNDR
ncbi:MAG: GntR family transcriptional regulator [Ruminococcaceae bacterium]|nr:GntR family transcriptional regulator [Oscillospiraceae bacterium]